MMNLKDGQLFVDINDQHVQAKMSELELMQTIVALESIAMHDYHIAPDELEKKKFAAAFICAIS